MTNSQEAQYTNEIVPHLRSIADSKEAIKDLMGSAKDAGLNTKAIRKAANEMLMDSDKRSKGAGIHSDLQAMANAQIIAAAPEMADAIAALLETYEPYPGGSAWDAYQNAKAALAKARGECSK